MDVRCRVLVDLFPEDRASVRFDPHGEGVVVQVGNEDLVALVFDDHRQLRVWAASLVLAVDRHYGPPAPPVTVTEEPEPAKVGGQQFVYGKGE